MATMAAPITHPSDVGHWPAPTAGGWTVDMLAALPDDGWRYELVDGVLLVSPAPAPRHQLAAAALFRLLDAACPPGYRTFFAPVDWQPDDRTSLEPDLLILSREHYRETGGIGSIVVAIEIASPSTARIDRTVKMDRYAEGGVAQYWLVDPGTGEEPPSVTVFDLGEHGYRRVAHAAGEQSVSVILPMPGPTEPAVTIVPADLLAW